jgi:hypothetical protein
MKKLFLIIIALLANTGCASFYYSDYQSPRCTGNCYLCCCNSSRGPNEKLCHCESYIQPRPAFSPAAINPPRTYYPVAEPERTVRSEPKPRRRSLKRTIREEYYNVQDGNGGVTQRINRRTY